MKPARLKPGDWVAIVATARAISMEEIIPAKALLESWGLQVYIAENIGISDHQFAGNDTIRAQAFQSVINRPEIRAILCARGGYGTVRMVDLLDLSVLQKDPKWIIGYSDVTVLHNELQRIHIPSVHGMMCYSLLPDRYDEESVQSLKALLFNETPPGITFETHTLSRKGKASGKLIGGNLSVWCSLLSSKSDIQTAQCILLLEDLDEYLYHIDRMMMALKRSGKLSQLAGLVVGGMSDMKDNTIPFGKSAYDIIREHVNEYTYPVAFGAPIGHEKRNLAVCLGETYVLQVEENRSKLDCL